MRLYAKEAKLGLEAQNYAAEIKLRAERKAGELLADMKDSGERAAQGDNQWSSQAATTKLADLGITRDQSSRWQQVAAISSRIILHQLRRLDLECLG